MDTERANEETQMGFANHLKWLFFWERQNLNDRSVKNYTLNMSIICLETLN